MRNGKLPLEHVRAAARLLGNLEYVGLAYGIANVSKKWAIGPITYTYIISHLSIHYLATMNALKISLKIQDCLLPSLPSLNRATVRMLKCKLLAITQLHLAYTYNLSRGIYGNVLDLL